MATITFSVFLSTLLASCRGLSLTTNNKFTDGYHWLLTADTVVLRIPKNDHMKKINSLLKHTGNVRVPSFSFLIFVVVLVLSADAGAQNKWRFELRPGVNFATTDLGDASLKTGFGAEGTLAYQFMPHLGAYAGWSWNRFVAEKSFAGNNTDFEETGYTLGLQFIHPFEGSALSYLVRGGAIYNHIEAENNSGDIIADTGHGWGWQIGGGIGIKANQRLLLLPEVRYRSLSRNMSIGDQTTPLDLRYISVGVGLSFAF